jgi:hypothetical protein
MKGKHVHNQQCTCFQDQQQLREAATTEAKTEAPTREQKKEPDFNLKSCLLPLFIRAITQVP